MHARRGAQGCSKSLHKDGLAVRELVAADWAGAVVVQPLADAAMAEAVLARQLSDVCAAFESVHADVALAAQVCPASGRLYDTHHCRSSACLPTHGRESR
jgi:hypothetical protein